MKYDIYFCFFIILGMASSNLQAQDPHFSQNYAAPIFVNPAMTGLFQGDYRFSGIYRNQWSSILPDASFRTMTVSAEKAFQSRGSNNRFSTGLMIYNDRAGDLGWQTNYIDLALAYNLALSQTMYISAGIEGGITQKSFDLVNAQFDDQYDIDSGTASGSTTDVIETSNLMRGNLAGGVMLYRATSHRKNLYGGVAMFHLTNPNLLVTAQEVISDNLFSKITAQVGGSFPIGSRLDLVPSFYFFKQGSSSEILGGTFFRFLLSDNPRLGLSRAFNIGSWVRLGDTNGQNSPGLTALVLTGKVDYDQFSVGVSYDITFSQLETATAGRGSVEIALIYTGASPKKRQPLTCPTF